MNLKGVDLLVEVDWKNFEKDKKYFSTVSKIWQKNTCERAAFLKTLQAAINFQRFPIKQSVEATLKVLGKSLKT